MTQKEHHQVGRARLPVGLFLFHVGLFLLLSLPAQEPRKEFLYPGCRKNQPLPGAGVAWGSHAALPRADGFTPRFIALYGPDRDVL